MEATLTMDRAQAAARVAAARSCRSTDHRAMLVELNSLFRAGRVPQAPLNGPYAGTFITTTFGRAADVAFGALGRVYMPWRGKVFDATAHSGRNLFTARSKLLIRPFDPAVRDDRPGLVSAYPFATSTGPGVIDRDRTVLNSAYELASNPFGPIRRV